MSDLAQTALAGGWADGPEIPACDGAVCDREAEARVIGFAS